MTSIKALTNQQNGSDRPTPTIVYVLWADSSGYEGWQSVEDVRLEEVLCESVGFLVGETNEVLALALSHCKGHDHRELGSAIVIPKRAVLQRKELRHETNNAGN